MAMASKRSAKSKGLRSSGSRAANSPTSSTTSSSKQFLETSVDGLSSPASSSARSKTPYSFSESVPSDAKENVTVTVRFRPLNPREIRHGEEIAWYADGETVVRNEYNPSLAYAYDRVFGPTTTTRQVYDVAAQHIISGAMEGINGTIFAYGVTSSGKTHTMHGDQRSPGIIPLAVKDAFSIIQETPNREFLLRVSYLEIYNEVVNDLLNPAGQNLRIREDAQGTFVEGIKEEVVLSPAHALSLIAAGEEHRHVGSTNFNLLSSRSHTIFSLTVESSPCGENSEGQAVALSQLNLIDLAGSESSRAETTGMRRREGSYINKSLLTLGTVISKLTEGRASHIPYRDSKLTRLLQSSLSGHGRISLICTVTPSSSNAEETHNTLKFAHRAKHVEIQAAQNTIIDEKSLIKKYQYEIQRLKEELEQMKRGVVSLQPKETDEVDFVLLKQKLEDGQVKLQSRLEEEEDAKAALLGRIQRLTKLILVSTKPSHSTRFSNRPGPRRRHSFGEEELAYLPYKRRDLISDDENTDLHVNLEGNVETADDSYKEEKKTKKHGLLNWLKMRKRDTGLSAFSGTSDKSCGTKSVSTPSTPLAESGNRAESRHSHSLPAQSSPSADFVSSREDKEIHEDRVLGQETPLISVKSIDEIDLLREQQKILSEEVALHSSTLKRLSQEAARNPPMDQIHVEMERLKDEIRAKKEQINFLQKQIADSIIASDKLDESKNLTELMTQLNEKSFELEVKIADNHIIQEQLNQKIRECESLQETVGSLKQQLADALELRNLRPISNHSQHCSVTKGYHDEPYLEKETATINNSNEKILLQQQASEIEELKQKLAEITESKEQLELRNHKLAEESSYAKDLASAAAVELKALSEEVAKLMNQNERLLAEQAVLKNSPAQRRNSGTGTVRSGKRESHVRRNDQGGLNSDIKRELALSKERELSYEAALLDRDHKEAELQRTIEESKQREAYLENELANMWVLVAKLKKSQGAETDV
ncbi:kinesin-like protein KIN-7K, chloroplastic isoform X1 [Vigna radiata var. radiata]|uniref:Kinesin-like protein n=2 Tax=Vigna radiata var. radiata TaxID=3916 RepID=A0A1S3V5I8_VIGRR|nr:kinesin-like protein KIN-7K, chloroplastic isoform X1 [Vigna radiata var. radiata]XP_014513617.1 kinesin-like protein KIN-7K, chloroplastic isoform X1 [Vigna radiata var. radiata]XP_014513618.1 kinesin-like protein KIN-7K, chloroplastic isoform X1 [Vigna radiata var. radiata]